MKIYTRTGDDGQTGLFRGPRTSKDGARIEAYGAVDEANAWIGFARTEASGTLDSMLEQIQNDLFAVGAEFATPDPGAAGTQIIDADDTSRLEHWIDELEAELSPLASFVLPGGVELAARLHLCRTTLRRAERRAWTLANGDEQLGPESLKYLNRLSDLLFVMARFANSEAGVEDTPWLAPKKKPSSP